MAIIQLAAADYVVAVTSAVAVAFQDITLDASGGQPSTGSPYPRLQMRVYLYSSLDGPVLQIGQGMSNVTL